MPYINVNDVYIMDNTGKQVDDAVDYALANSNRNLLDNPWFRIDQRSVSGTITSGYIADRWTITYGSGGVIASRTDNSVTVQPTNGQSHGDIAQRMEKALFDFLVGRTVTASVMRSDGSVISKSFTFQSGVNSIDVGPDLDGNLISVRVYQTSTYQNVQFWKWKTAGTFRAVKLELGSYSTLANDVPPKKRSALADCQERFLRVKSDTTVGVVGFGSQTKSDRAYILIPTPVTMELNANNTMSVSLTGTARLVGNGSGSINVTSVSFVSREANGVLIACFGSNIAANQTYNLYLTSGSYIDISGDL